MKLDAKALRVTEPTQEELDQIKRNPIVLVIDEVLDTYNIGSMFRLADALAMEKVYLCGEMEYPPSIKIHRSAVGTENWVPWKKSESAVSTVNELIEKGYQIIVAEQSEGSVPYWELGKDASVNFPAAVVVGHETSGVSKEVIDLADIIVELPMLGINKSFNVWGTASIIGYKMLELLR